MTVKSIVPALFAGAKRVAARTVDSSEERQADSLTTIAATGAAVMVVALIAVLLGMS